MQNIRHSLNIRVAVLKKLALKSMVMRRFVGGFKKKKRKEKISF